MLCFFPWAVVVDRCPTPLSWLDFPKSESIEKGQAQASGAGYETEVLMKPLPWILLKAGAPPTRTSTLRKPTRACPSLGNLHPVLCRML